MPADDSPTLRNDVVVRRALALSAAAAFAAFVVVKGVPALRHDWSWPTDRLAIGAFFNESVSGWLAVGFGVANPHPTTYLIALPLAAAMWLLGPLLALAAFAFATAYCTMGAAENIAARWGNGPLAATGIGLFALFNPWVYNEVVAGHLVMVLAYGALLGLVAEMARGADASPVRLALWIALAQAQLQFFIVGVVALAIFAGITKKWLPLAAAALVALPSAIGVIAERGALLQIPYSVQWQANQSVAPWPLLSLGGYFPGYADRLGPIAQIATLMVLALALCGALLARRTLTAIGTAAAASLIYVAALGVHGPFAGAYVWMVRAIPESGVFRELYDLAGIFAVLLAVLACAATARIKALAYVAAAAGIALPFAWLVHPPSDLWVSARAFPRANVSAPAFARVALMPAFQPLQMRDGEGDGADPDAIVYPGNVAALNDYLPAYPVDAALARYERSGETSALRALGVAEVVARPWFVSRSNGAIGLAAASIASGLPARSGASLRRLDGFTPLLSQCDGSRVVASVDRLGSCDVFFGDAPGYATVAQVAANGDSIDARTGWIAATLAFAREPSLAQGIGGALTQSALPHEVDSNAWLLAYVRGRLSAQGGRTLASGRGEFSWIWVPPNVGTVTCAGLCELVAQARTFPAIPIGRPAPQVRAVAFTQLAPWLYRVRTSPGIAQLVRLNARYDPAWIALDAGRILPHLRVDLCANGWFLPDGPANDVLLVQAAALLQLAGELVGIACVVLLLKALLRAPTKRVGRDNNDVRSVR